jgi:hypothetical protein
MTRTTKILLACSLAAFALGFTDILWGLGRPVGAILFGFFMISKVLEKETALYDEEQRLRLVEATRVSRQAQETAKKPSLPMSVVAAHAQ